MTNSRQTTAGTLDDLSAKLLAVDPGDKESVAQVGLIIEEVLSEAAKLPGDICMSLSLALETLQSVYEDGVGEASTAMGAIASTVAAAGECLSSGNGPEEVTALQEATENLQAILSPGSGPPAVEGEAQPSPKPSGDQNAESDPTSAVSDDGKEDMASTLPQDADLELLGEFITECVDHISGGEAALLDLESNPDDNEQINTVFRAFHTIKGTSGFLGLDQVQKLSHLAENLLDRAREGQIKIVGGYADLALKSCDALRTMIEGLEGLKPGAQLVIPDYYSELLIELSNPEDVGIGEEASVEEMRLGDILVGKNFAKRSEVEKAAKEQGGRRIGEVLIEKKAVTPSDVAEAIRTQKKISGRTTEATIRVGTGRLDSLINMVGELVIAQSMVAEDSEVIKGSAPRLAKNVSHAGKIIRELQDLTMALRMVPLKGTFQKMARLVRDLARKAGKSVQFITEGEETEIDRNMVEVLNDPLTHMMRNAVDHGVETNEQRAAAGKDPTGTVRLRAYHSAGNIVIELEDNGKGLDREKILAKALDRGLVETDRKLSDSEAFGLIFQPGFSTAEKVTNVSGRGVGMDVVKKGIDSLRGRIEVTSKEGEGSTFTMHVPLTMAITDAMLVRVSNQRYLLPIVSIEQSFRPEPNAVSTVTGRGEMVVFRGDLLPVFRLHKLFKVSGAATNPHEALLIIIEGEGKRCALMVDELLGQQQVVIKSLGKSMGQIRGVAGGAILGDGQIGLILDAAGLVGLAGGEGRNARGLAATAA